MVKYETAELDIIKFDAEDVITTSCNPVSCLDSCNGDEVFEG